MFDGACQIWPNRKQKHLVVGDARFGNSDIAAIFGGNDSQEIELRSKIQSDVGLDRGDTRDRAENGCL